MNKQDLTEPILRQHALSNRHFSNGNGQRMHFRFSPPHHGLVMLNGLFRIQQLFGPLRGFFRMQKLLSLDFCARF